MNPFTSGIRDAIQVNTDGALSQTLHALSYPRVNTNITKDMNMPEETKQAPEWYTTKQAAEKMQITREAVQRLCRDGRITCEKWGRDWMVHRDSVESYEITVGGRGKKAGDD